MGQDEGSFIRTQRDEGVGECVQSRDERAQKRSRQEWTHLRTWEGVLQAWAGLESLMAREWYGEEPRQGMAAWLGDWLAVIALMATATAVRRKCLPASQGKHPGLPLVLFSKSEYLATFGI